MTGKPRVLLVDDEPWFGEALRVSLEAQGLECRCETDMTEALRYLENNEVAVVVTDVMMPAGRDYRDIDSTEAGLRLVSMLRERWPRVPVICLSVIGDLGKIRSLRRLGVRYLRKGETTLNTAVDVIRRAAGRHSI